MECSFREVLYVIKSGMSVVGYSEHEIFRILKIGVLRHDVKLEPHPYDVE